MKPEQEWNILQSILFKLTETHSQLRVLFLEQRKALTVNDIEALRAIQLRMDDLGEAIALLDARRVSHMERLSTGKNHPMQSLESLMALYADLPAEDMRRIAGQLRAEVGECLRLRNVNISLIQMSRELVRSTVEAIVGLARTPQERAFKTYGAGGAYAPRRPSDQPHLVNKKG